MRFRKSHLADDAVEVGGGILLAVNTDDVSTSLGEVGHAGFRLLNHLREEKV